MGVHGLRAEVLLAFTRLLRCPETGYPDTVGYIHNGPVMTWSYMNAVPYILTDQGVLMPQFRAGDWEAIADDALDAMVALLEAVAANGGPDVPEGLRRPVGRGGGLGSQLGWAGSAGPRSGGGWGWPRSAGDLWWRGTR